MKRSTLCVAVLLLMSEDGKWHCYDFQRLGQD